MRLAFLFLIFLTSCSEPESKATQLSNRIKKQFIKTENKRGLRAVGIGGGIYREQINSIFVGFQIDEVLTVERARTLLVNMIEEFKCIVESQPGYEDHFPVDEPLEDHLSTTLFGLEPREWHTDYISTASARLGKVRYARSGPPSNPNDFETVLRETFQEAKAIVDGESCCEPRDRSDCT